MSSILGYLSEDTIAAISSGTGGAISILRISGPQSFDLLEKLSHSKAHQQSEFKKLTRAQLYFPDSKSQKLKPLDDALFVKFKAPASYTGEDVVELHIHGGHYLSQRTLEILMEYGARQALPGEFSFRAVRNGKMNLFQAHAVMDLISASNDSAVTLALEKISGNQNQWIENLGIEIRQLCALSEVGIDFSDQDVEEVSLPSLKKKLKFIQTLLIDAQQSYQKGYRVQEGLSITLIGLPNAGKSSFFNALLGENRSIVSEFEGTTRDLVSEKMTFKNGQQSFTIRLEDTAGLRNADHPVEKMGIEKSYEAIEKSDLILFLVDAHSEISPSLLQWEELLTKSSSLIKDKTLGILTKIDLINSSEDLLPIHSQLEKFSIPHWINYSLYQKIGLQEVVKLIGNFCEKWTARKPNELILTRIEHYQAVQKALKIVDSSLESTELDLFASDVRQILHSLNPLIGETLVDDILGKIFSDFCIGK